MRADPTQNTDFRALDHIKLEVRSQNDSAMEMIGGDVFRQPFPTAWRADLDTDQVSAPEGSEFQRSWDSLGEGLNATMSVLGHI